MSDRVGWLGIKKGVTWDRIVSERVGWLGIK